MSEIACMPPPRFLQVCYSFGVSRRVSVVDPEGTETKSSELKCGENVKINLITIRRWGIHPPQPLRDHSTVSLSVLESKGCCQKKHGQAKNITSIDPLTTSQTGISNRENNRQTRSDPSKLSMFPTAMAPSWRLVTTKKGRYSGHAGHENSQL